MPHFIANVVWRNTDKAFVLGTKCCCKIGDVSSVQCVWFAVMSLFLCFSDGGSDSSVSDGLPVHLQYMADKVRL